MPITVSAMYTRKLSQVCLKLKKAEAIEADLQAVYNEKRPALAMVRFRQGHHEPARTKRCHC